MKSLFDDEIILAGSFRRGTTDSKDIDLLMISDSTTTRKILDSLPKDVYYPVLKGEKKLMLYSLRDDQAVKIDLNIVPKISRAVALVHFTGSASNNIRLRVAAKKRGLLLNDKYIQDRETGEVMYPKTEEEVFDIVGVKFATPEERS